MSSIVQTSALVAFLISLGVGTAHAQEQQAGADGGKTEEAFQALIAKCDNTDLLVKRGKVRLILGRIDEAAASEAQGKIDEGFAKCGEGDLDAAGKALDEAFEIADAAAANTFNADATAEAETVSQDEAESATADTAKPWWKFW